MFAGSHLGEFWALSRYKATIQYLDRRFSIRVNEHGNTVSINIAEFGLHTVWGTTLSAIGPTLHQVTSIDDNGIVFRRNRMPGTLRVLNLKPTDIFLEQ